MWILLIVLMYGLTQYVDAEANYDRSADQHELTFFMENSGAFDAMP